MATKKRKKVRPPTRVDENGYAKLSPAQLEELDREIRKNSIPDAVLAKKWKQRRVTVWRLRKKLGLPSPAKRGRPKKDPDEQQYELETLTYNWDWTLTNKELAAGTNVRGLRGERLSPSGVNYIRQVLGIPSATTLRRIIKVARRRRRKRHGAKTKRKEEGRRKAK